MSATEVTANPRTIWKKGLHAWQDENEHTVLARNHPQSSPRERQTPQLDLKCTAARNRRSLSDRSVSKPPLSWIEAHVHRAPLELEDYTTDEFQ